MKQHLNAKEAAEFLGIHRCTFFSHIKGELPSYQIHAKGRKVYALSDLQAYMERNKQQSGYDAGKGGGH